MPLQSNAAHPMYSLAHDQVAHLLPTIEMASTSFGTLHMSIAFAPLRDGIDYVDYGYSVVLSSLLNDMEINGSPGDRFVLGTVSTLRTIITILWPFACY